MAKVTKAAKSASVASPRLTAVPGVLWREDFCCFGSVKSVCVGAWAFFLLLPGLFFWLVMPGLRARLGPELALVPVGLWGLSALCFVCAACWDPGVPRRTAAVDKATLEHPGDAFTLSRDSNRYVSSFDHFCEFVGNDIGGGNMPCFVGFLVSLALLATALFLSCVAAMGAMWFGWHVGDAPEGPRLHFASEPLPYVLAGAVLLALLALLRSCWSSPELCAGTMPLIMMMPGATAGMALLFLLLVAVVELPMVSDMWQAASWQRNPAPLYLMLPILAFAVIFCSMSAHWVWLLCSGLSQKLWLKAQGFRSKRAKAQELV